MKKLLLILGLISLSFNAFAADSPCNGSVSAILCGGSGYKVNSIENCKKEDAWLIVVNLDCKDDEYEAGNYFSWRRYVIDTNERIPLKVGDSVKSYDSDSETLQLISIQN